MKNYKNSDYAVNKHSDGIVYKFNDGAHEITLEEFLASDSSLTEGDFLRWKRLSRLSYYRQDRDDNAQTKKNISIRSNNITSRLTTPSIEDSYIETCDLKYSADALRWVLESNVLTEIQHRRFILHFINGFSLRKIASIEGVFFTSVAESINAAVAKIKKEFY